MNKSAASGRLDHGFFFAIFGRASGQKIAKNMQKIAFLGPRRLQAPKCWFLAPGAPETSISKLAALFFAAAALFLQYLAALAAKFIQKICKNSPKGAFRRPNAGFGPPGP